MRRTRFAILVIILLTATAFLPVMDADFLDFDDHMYITENKTVLKGLHAEGLGWAFTTVEAGNWHPLTWISHMLDVTLFGVRPGPHHLVNLVMHTMSAILLMLLLNGMTGAWWPSFITAAIFSIHPLRVESVAWIAERKDVLSVLLGMLALLAYLRNARRPGAGRYLTVVCAFAAGLMAKPMLVTLPFVLLLLDWWPLGRFHQALSPTTSAPRTGPWRLLREKIPLLTLSGIACVLTYLAQQKGGAVKSDAAFPLVVRIANALVSYIGYLGKLVWPHDLIPFYLHPGASLRHTTAAIALVLLTVVTLSALVLRKRHPWLATGWLWYLGTLVPVIGLVQVGTQAMADRYSYLPHIGLLVAISWEARSAATRQRWGRSLFGAGAAAVITTLAFLTWNQSNYWKNTATLSNRIMTVDPRNPMAYNMLGAHLLMRHETAAATRELQKAIAIGPGNLNAHFNLGLALAESGDLDGAMEQFLIVVRLNPRDDEGLFNLGKVLLDKGRAGEALQRFEAALALRPDQPAIRLERGIALARMNRLPEAADDFRRVLALDAQNSEARHNLRMALDAMSRSGFPSTRSTP